MTKKVLFFGFLLTVHFNLLQAQNLPQKPDGWVADYAGVIDSQSHQKMLGVIRELEQKTGAEIAVVTIKSLGNESMDSFSVQLFKKWGIGKKGKDNGVLLVAAIEDRKTKIEVGYGLEGILPDGLCGEILDKYVVPYFKQSKYSEGLMMGAIALASVIAKDASVELTGGMVAVGQPVKRSPLSMLIKLLLFLILIPIFIRNPFLLLLFLGAGRGGGGGGFSGGFGGFGGGMSGGGGAGRSW